MGYAAMALTDGPQKGTVPMRWLALVVAAVLWATFAIGWIVIRVRRTNRQLDQMLTEATRTEQRGGVRHRRRWNYLSRLR